MGEGCTASNDYCWHWCEDTSYREGWPYSWCPLKRRFDWLPCKFHFFISFLKLSRLRNVRCKISFPFIAYVSLEHLRPNFVLFLSMYLEKHFLQSTFYFFFYFLHNFLSHFSFISVTNFKSYRNFQEISWSNCENTARGRRRLNHFYIGMFHSCSLVPGDSMHRWRRYCRGGDQRPGTEDLEGSTNRPE